MPGIGMRGSGSGNGFTSQNRGVFNHLNGPVYNRAPFFKNSVRAGYTNPTFGFGNKNVRGLDNHPVQGILNDSPQIASGNRGNGRSNYHSQGSCNFQERISYRSRSCRSGVNHIFVSNGQLRGSGRDRGREDIRRSNIFNRNTNLMQQEHLEKHRVSRFQVVPFPPPLHLPPPPIILQGAPPHSVNNSAAAHPRSNRLRLTDELRAVICKTYKISGQTSSGPHRSPLSPSHIVSPISSLGERVPPTSIPDCTLSQSLRQMHCSLPILRALLPEPLQPIPKLSFGVFVSGK